MKEAIWEYYKSSVAWAVLIIITLIVIFGGKITIAINWNSWSELINHFKNYH